MLGLVQVARVAGQEDILVAGEGCLELRDAPLRDVEANGWADIAELS